MSDWRSLFKASPDQALEYFEPSSRNGTPLVTPPPEVFEVGVGKWKYSVLAQFLGEPPGFMFLQRTLSKLWEKHGSIKFYSIGSNLFVFQFESEKESNWVLEHGPWHVQNNPMIIRRWVPNMGTLELDFHRLPLWFHLHNVPLDLYHGTGLSHIASAIGLPMYMDSVTASTTRLAFAKVCVEVSADTEPPTEVDVALADGSIATVGVTIPWRPLVCHRCKIFGHTDKTCTRKQGKSVWREKDKSAEDKVFDEKAQGASGSAAPEEPGSAGAFGSTAPEHPAPSGASGSTAPEKPGSAGATGSTAPEQPASSGASGSTAPEHPAPAGASNSNAPESGPDAQAAAAQSPSKTVAASALGKGQTTTAKKPVSDSEGFTEVNSRKNRSKAAPSSQSSSSKQKFTGSTNKYIALRADEEEGPEETREYDDVNAQVWKELIENATFTPVKTRAQTKGLDKVYANLNDKKKQIVARGGKRPSVAPSPRGRR